MSAGTARHRIAALVAALVTTGMFLAGCDADGDGFDDQTGRPVPTAASDTQSSGDLGCDPNGFGPLSGCDSGSDAQDAGQDGPGFVPDDRVSQEWIAMAARHEAGHAAVAREYGWRLRFVQIYPDGSGETKLAGFGWPCTCPQKRVTLLLAGAVAAGSDAGAEQDYTDTADVLADLPPAEADRIQTTARAEAARIIHARSAEIDRDAAQLQAEGRLR